MSNLLRATQNPPFGWVVRWEETDDIGRPLEDREAALRQPDRLKVKFDVPDGGTTRAAGTREATAEVTPDKGVFGAEYALVFTIPEFKKKIQARLDQADLAAYVAKLFSLFGECLQGDALVKWRAVLQKKHMPEADRTEESFVDALRDYLEEIEDLTDLGNVIVRSMRTLKKPAWMVYDRAAAVRGKWKGYLDEGLVRCTIARPTEQEACEEIFLSMPKAYQTKYAEKHSEVECDEEKLRVFFKGCETADRNDGTYAKIMKAQADGARARAAKAARDRGASRTPRATGSPRGYRRGDRDYRSDQTSGGRSYRSSDRNNHRSGGGSNRNGGRDSYRGRGDRHRGYSSRGGYSGRNDRERGESGRDGRDRNHHDRGGRGSNDRGRDRGRDSRSRHQGGRNSTYHVDEEMRDRSRSPSRERSPTPPRSPSRSRTPSRSRSRSQSRDRSVEAYHGSWADQKGGSDNVMAEEAAYWRGLKRKDGEVSRRPAKRAKDVRWVREMARGKSETDRDGVPVGFGSFYKRCPGIYSQEELEAPQGHADRVRTADLIPEHKYAREQDDDDSELESDWHDRTSVDPDLHRAHRETEEKMQARRERERKHM